MDIFEEREKGFEAKYRRDQEQRFKIVARRNKLLGLWAAEKMGLAGAAADAYAKEVVASALEKPGDDALSEKVAADLHAKGHAADAAAVREELKRLAATAKEQVMAEAEK